MDSECVCCGVYFRSSDAARVPLIHAICPSCTLEIREVSLWLGEDPEGDREPSCD
jgi:hypothetical protein